MKNMKN